MRRAFSTLLPIVLLVSLLAPATAAGAPPIRFTDRSTSFFCEMPTEDGGLLATGANVSDEFTFAHLDLWPEGSAPFEDPPALSGFTETVDQTGTPPNVTLTATLALFDPEGEPAGVADLTATLAPDGDPIVLEPHREGNRQIRSTGTIQPATVSGEVVIDGGDPITLSGCFGQFSDVEVFETNPNAFTIQETAIIVACEWAVGEDGFAFFFAQAHETFGTFAEAGYFTETSQLITDFDAPQIVSLDRESLSASVPMIDLVTGDPASAEASASITPSGIVESFTITGQNGRQKITAEGLLADGSVEFSNGASFPIDETCFSVDFSAHSVFTQPAGPKRGGKVPPNDTPGGALPLAPGTGFNVQTGGAAIEPEAEASCAPIGTTLWYTVTGTGGPVTIDTAGSGFDTVIAVYVGDGGGLVEVDCVDDVATGQVGISLQSAVTIDTEAGQTYFVQIGGFAEEYGRLRVAVQ